MAEAIRVLTISNTYPAADLPGSSPSVGEQLAALQRRGVSVELLYIDNRSKANYVRAALSMGAEALHAGRYDLVHGYYGHCGVIGRMQWRYPLVITFLGSDILSRREGWLGRRLARLADAVILMSEGMKRAAGRPDAHVIPFGVNRRVFHPLPRSVARRDLGLEHDEELILFPWDPSRPVKRYDVAQEAVDVLNRMGHHARLVALCGRPPQVVAAHMNACDALILPSMHEGSPVSVREAMACNLPIVATDVGDVRQLIGDTEGCYVVERDPLAFAEALRSILEHRQRTTGAVRMAQEDSEWSAERVLSVYRQVLAAKGRGSR